MTPSRLPDDPRDVAPCDLCGCLVLLMPAYPGTVLLWDPDPLQRRFAMSVTPPLLVATRGFGPGRGGPHSCPPRGQRPLDRLKTPGWSEREEGGWN